MKARTAVSVNKDTLGMEETVQVTTSLLLYIQLVGPLYNGQPGAELSGHCREVARIVERFRWIGAQSGRRILVVVEVCC